MSSLEVEAHLRNFAQSADSRSATPSSTTTVSRGRAAWHQDSQFVYDDDNDADCDDMMTIVMTTKIFMTIT